MILPEKTLPKKITPDRIRESIVQIFYAEEEIPFEAMVGLFYSPLIELGYQYANRPPKQRNPISNDAQTDILFNLISPHIFFNEKIKIHLYPNSSFIFDCIGGYIGWEEYFSNIKTTIDNLIKHRVVNSFNRIGIRYISEFPNIDILEKVKFKFEMSGIEKRISNGNFRIEWIENQHRIVANIGAKLPVSTTLEINEVVNYVSILDIDVIMEGFDTDTTEELFNRIQATHIKEKSVFFELLQNDFLETLNPEY